jgi:hypothetical protein
MIDFKEKAVVLSDKVVLVIPPLAVVFTVFVRFLGDDGADKGNLASPPILLTKFCTFIGNFRAQVVERLVLTFSYGLSDPASN